MEWNRVIAALQRLADRGAVDKLLYLRKVRDKPALASNIDYRQTFTGYYKIRLKRVPGGAPYDCFYSMLQQAAAAPSPPSLKEILQGLYDHTKRRYLSFGSKMLATVTDEAIIFDENVASHFGVSTSYVEDWLPDALQRYEQIRQQIQAFTNAPEWQHLRAMFDRSFPIAVDLPDIRKADLIIWAAYSPAFIIPFPCT